MGTSKRKSAPGGARGNPDPERADDDPAESGSRSAPGETDPPSSGSVLDLDRTRLAERIEPDEVHGWARQLGVSPERLREAIRVAGDSLEDVKRYLTTLH